MEEIKDANLILKARWPEVLLLLTLNLLFSLGHLPLQQQVKECSLLGLAVLVLILAFTVINAMLLLGFQCSVCLEGRKRQSPLYLLRLGKHFFWRAVWFGLLLLFTHVLLAWLVFLVVRQPLAISTGFWKTAQSEPLVYFSCYAVSQLMLIKPILFILPIVIITDCRISASFRLLKQFSLSEVDGLVIVYLTSTALTVLRAFLPTGAVPRTISHYVLHVPLFLTQGLVGLMIGLMAIRFVGSHNLLGEVDHERPNSGDSSS